MGTGSSSFRAIRAIPEVSRTAVGEESRPDGGASRIIWHLPLALSPVGLCLYLQLNCAAHLIVLLVCSYFYATLYLGTPAKKFAVIVDTGSTMTYVPCSTCGSGCGPNHQDAAFDPEVGTMPKNAASGCRSHCSFCVQCCRLCCVHIFDWPANSAV